MPLNQMKAIFYEKSLKENKPKTYNLGITTLYVIVFCVILIILIGIQSRNSNLFSCVTKTTEDKQFQVNHLISSLPSLVPANVNDFHNLLQVDDKFLCHEWEIVPPPKPYKGEDLMKKWRLGTSICKDFLPKKLTPSDCRIYSVRYDGEDMTFETKKGEDGCRIHVWGNKTIYSYMKLSSNVYFYPLEIDAVSRPGIYSIEDFAGLMGHKHLQIQYVKSTTKDGHHDMLRSLYSSKHKVWERIDQIQFLLYLPKISPETWPEVETHYRNIVGLKYLGFALARVRPDPRYIYTVKDDQNEEKELEFSTIYELVWINTRKK